MFFSCGTNPEHLEQVFAGTVKTAETACCPGTLLTQAPSWSGCWDARCTSDFCLYFRHFLTSVIGRVTMPTESCLHAGEAFQGPTNTWNKGLSSPRMMMSEKRWLWILFRFEWLTESTWQWEREKNTARINFI